MSERSIDDSQAGDERRQRFDGKHPRLAQRPQREAFLLARMRDDLLGPLEDVIACSEMLQKDAREQERPAEYLADVDRMTAAAKSLYQFIEGKLRAGDLREGDFVEELKRLRHDIGNHLNHVNGFCQILLLTESDQNFGRFTGDLNRILAACGTCTARLLKYRQIEEGGDAALAAVIEAPPAATDSNAVVESNGSAAAVAARPPDDAPAVANEAPVAPRRVAPGRILVVEDSEHSRTILTRLLERDGHTVRTAVDGLEALRVVETEDFDLILLDVFMPGLDGFEVLARLKSDEGFRHIPVIVISGLDETDNAIRAIGAGAEDFLTKPVNQVLLQARVDACLDKLRLREREFSQVFPPEVARRYARRRDVLMRGRDADVTVLFCDIRGFSRLSERLEPALTVQWLSDVMDDLTECVMQQRGTIVDYIGDELMAMWGAPDDMPDHAQRATQAARDMIERLPELNRRWESVVGGAMDLGIGLNSGAARVGNTGSTRKLKYGPLGNTVNLASRVQGATKHTRTRLLVTGATAGKWGEGFPSRRLCRVRVVNIEEPIELHEVFTQGSVDWDRLKLSYEKALGQFEAGKFRAAASTLGVLLGEFPEDGPSLLLLSRSVNQLLEEKPSADLVWRLPGK